MSTIGWIMLIWFAAIGLHDEWIERKRWANGYHAKSRP